MKTEWEALIGKYKRIRGNTHSAQLSIVLTNSGTKDVSRCILVY